MPEESDRLVKLAEYNNEPLARMDEEYLKNMGVQCMVRPLGQGTAYAGFSSIPYGLYVLEHDKDRAEQLLGGTKEE